MKNVVKLETKEAIKLGLMALASGAICFYTGPIASVVARETFNIGYDLLYGIPNWYNPSFSLTYMPLREHAAHYGYAYGGLLLGSICAPLIYKGINLASNLGGKIATTLCTPYEEQSSSTQFNQKTITILQFSVNQGNCQKNERPLKIVELPETPYSSNVRLS